MIPLFEARDLRRRVSSRFVLDVPELAIGDEEIVSILGPSGSGKSTLLKIIGLMEDADSGELIFEGQQVNAKSRFPRLRIASLLQSVPLFSGTVAHNVGYPLRVRGVSSDQREPIIREVLELVGMTGNEERPVAQLSGGEAQRVGLARALAAKPRLLLLDEPLAHSDEPLRESLALSLKRVAKEGGFSLVWITHDRSEALRIADRVAVMAGGKLLQIDSPLELITRPADAQVAAVVGTENIWEGDVVRSNAGLARVRVGNIDLEVESSLPSGSEVLILLRPEDVTVTSDKPVGVVPRNQFPVSIGDAIHGVGTVKLLMKGPLDVVGLMTRQSFEDLGLSIGGSVWCSFKATACYLLRRY